MDGYYHFFVRSLFLGVFFERNSVDSVEKFFEIFLNGSRLRPLRKNLEQRGVTDEVETRELLSLAF